MNVEWVCAAINYAAPVHMSFPFEISISQHDGSQTHSRIPSRLLRRLDRRSSHSQKNANTNRLSRKVSKTIFKMTKILQHLSRSHRCLRRSEKFLVSLCTHEILWMKIVSECHLHSRAPRSCMWMKSLESSAHDRSILRQEMSINEFSSWLWLMNIFQHVINPYLTALWCYLISF